MSVEDVFSITGRGTVATGRIERGRIKVGEGVEIVGLIEKPLTSVVQVWKCSANCWMKVKLVIMQVLLLRGIEKTQIRRGMVICKARFYHSAH